MPQVSEPPKQSGLPKAWMPLRYHPAQKAAWRTSARFVCLPCGRRSGKTTLALRRLVRFLPVDRGHGAMHRYAFLAPTRQQAKEVAWNELKQLTPPHWLSEPPREGELTIRCRFGHHESELRVVGMDKPKRFEGVGYDGVVSDESSDQKPSLDLSVRPAIDDRLGWWWMIGVPKRQGVGAKRYREYCEKGFKGEPDWETYTWPSWDILPESVIEAARRDMDEKDFNEQYGAAWETVGGAAFHAFDDKVNVRQCAYDPLRPLFIGSDFNVDPMAWVVAHPTEDGLGLEVVDEIWLRGTTTQKTLDVLYQRYGKTHKGGFIFYGDATGQARHTAAAASDYAQIKQDMRFKSRVAYPRSNPARKDRLSSCNALLRNAAGDVRCWIDPRCIHLISDLVHRGLDEQGNPVDASKDGGHISDAFGYIVHAKWPCTRIQPAGEKKISIFYGD